MKEDKLNYEELSELMEKVYEAMKMTEEKQGKITERENELHEEVRPLVVKEGLDEVEKLKENKKEFDEMTGNSLAIAKKQILIIREELEANYQKMLLDVLKRKQQVEEKLQSMKAKGIEDEKLEWANTSAKKAIEKINKELNEFQKEHFEKMNGLDKYEQEVEEFAIRIGMEDKLKIAEDTTKETEKKTKSGKESEEVDKPKESDKPKEPEGTDKPEESDKPKEPEGTDKPKESDKPKKPEEPNKPEESDKPKEPIDPKSQKIKSIEFKFHEAIPTYIITTEDGKRMALCPIYTEDERNMVDVTVYDKLNKEEREELADELNISNIHIYFDRGLENVLEQFDAIRQSKEREHYYKMLIDKHDGKEGDAFQLGYDLSDMHSADMSGSEKRNLKRMVKKCQKWGIAEYLSKPRNFFQRLFGIGKNKLLEKGNAAIINEEAKSRAKDITELDIERAYISGKDDPGFDEQLFWEQMEEQGIDQEKIATARQNLMPKTDKFRKEMREAAQQSEQQEPTEQKNIEQDRLEIAIRAYQELSKYPDFDEETFRQQQGISGEELAEIRERVTKVEVAKTVEEVKREQDSNPARTEQGDTNTEGDSIEQEEEDWSNLSMEEIDRKLAEIGINLDEDEQEL